MGIVGTISFHAHLLHPSNPTAEGVNMNFNKPITRGRQTTYFGAAAGYSVTRGQFTTYSLTKLAFTRKRHELLFLLFAAQSGSMSFRVGCVTVHVSQRLHPHCWQRCLVTASEWKRWQRCCDRLTKLQQRIKFPQPVSVTVKGVTYALPLKNMGPPEKEPTQEELEYLVGFFDGDGCVTMKSQCGQISLQIGQSIDSAQVLLLFRDKLGGGVSRHSNRTGQSKACLIWQVYSSTMHHAALLLGRIPSMKQGEIQIAAGAPIEKADQAKVAEQLKAFKRKDYCPKKLTITWPQFAGFFDAEGSVSVHHSNVAFELRIGQANPCVLKHVQQANLGALAKQRLTVKEDASQTGTITGCLEPPAGAERDHESQWMAEPIHSFRWGGLTACEKDSHTTKQVLSDVVRKSEESGRKGNSRPATRTCFPQISV